MIVRAVLALALLAGSLLLQPASPALADSYPSKPIKMVVPFPPGGPTDGLARIISDRLGQVLGQSVIIENHGGGAGGSIGAKVVASAEPDGYSILITPGGSLTTGPAVHTKIGYDPAKAFTPVALLMTAPMIMTVHPSLPVKTFPELIAYAKANPGKITAGSQGYGTGPHLQLEMMKLDYHLNILHVPYRGSAPAITALLGGHVDIIFDTLPSIWPTVQSGKLRALGVASLKRCRTRPRCRRSPRRCRASRCCPGKGSWRPRARRRR
jgi:putative tricarboxylic transport membrane protein